MIDQRQTDAPSELDVCCFRKPRHRAWQGFPYFEAGHAVCACPGKMGTGFPKGECALHGLLNVSPGFRTARDPPGRDHALMIGRCLRHSGQRQDRKSGPEQSFHQHRVCAQPLVHLFARRLDLVKQLRPELFDNAAQDRRTIDDFVSDNEKTNPLQLVIVQRLMHKRCHIRLRTWLLQWHCFYRVARAIAARQRQNSARRMMIGRGIPNNQSSAPLPKPI
jgi:hypothetical protein